MITWLYTRGTSTELMCKGYEVIEVDTVYIGRDKVTRQQDR
jgi:hypothetical protein